MVGDSSLLTIMKSTAPVEQPFEIARFIDAVKIAADISNRGKWQYNDDNSIRILPIWANHAPHYWKFNFLKGDVDTKKIEKLEKAGGWKGGESMAYLIDFMEQDSIALRIYLTGSANQYPLGVPPRDIIDDGKPVDIMFLCVASYQNVKNYPEKLMKHLQPKHVVFTHWENFFAPMHKLLEEDRVVPFTNVKKFIKLYMKRHGETPFTMPAPFTKIEVGY